MMDSRLEPPIESSEAICADPVNTQIEKFEEVQLECLEPHETLLLDIIESDNDDEIEIIGVVDTTQVETPSEQVHFIWELPVRWCYPSISSVQPLMSF